MGRNVMRENQAETVRVHACRFRRQIVHQPIECAGALESPADAAGREAVPFRMDFAADDGDRFGGVLPYLFGFLWCRQQSFYIGDLQRQRAEGQAPLLAHMPRTVQYDFRAAAADVDDHAVVRREVVNRPGEVESGFLLAGDDADGKPRPRLQRRHRFGAVLRVAQGGGGEGDRILDAHAREEVPVLGDYLGGAPDTLFLHHAVPDVCGEPHRMLALHDLRRVPVFDFIDRHADRVRPDVDHRLQHKFHHLWPLILITRLRCPRR